MKILVDIQDNKASFLMELLSNFRFVKTETIVPAKAQLIEDLKEAFNDVRLYEQGKKNLKSAKDLLNVL